MKILLVSMPSLHFFRWTEQLENSGHEIYWFDIVDGSPTKKLPWVKKINGWKIKYPNLKGRYFVKKRLPILYNLLRPIIEENPAKAFQNCLIEINPDVVHSFAMQISCLPIIEVMEKNPDLKWIYSSWGSDLFNLNSVKITTKQVTRIVKRTNYFFSDCLRDFNIIKDYGFTGVYLGCFPGGGGYKLSGLVKYINTPASERRTILIKGYQGKLGKSLAVLKAINQLHNELRNYKVIVFGADKEVLNFNVKNKLSNNLNISILSKNKFLPHTEVLKLMGEALLYIGNSISDGMPNTLIESVIMGAFPIQSNPGDASAEIITHGENGLLIDDPENIDEIKTLILKGLANSKLIEKAFIINQMEIKSNFEYKKIQNEVITAYNKVSKAL